MNTSFAELKKKPRVSSMVHSVTGGIQVGQPQPPANGGVTAQEDEQRHDF